MSALLLPMGFKASKVIASQRCDSFLGFMLRLLRNGSEGFIIIVKICYYYCCYYYYYYYYYHDCQIVTINIIIIIIVLIFIIIIIIIIAIIKKCTALTNLILIVSNWQIKSSKNFPHTLPRLIFKNCSGDDDVCNCVFSNLYLCRPTTRERREISPLLIFENQKSTLILEKKALTMVIFGLNFPTVSIYIYI